MSAFELSTFKMPSDGDLERSISGLKDEFRSGLSSLKRELAQEHDDALKKLDCYC